MDPTPRKPQEAAVVGAPAGPVKEVPIRWANMDAPVHFANISWSIVDDLGDLIVSFGRVEPSPISATDQEQRRKQLEAIDHVDGQLLFRFATSPERLRQIIVQLEQALQMREDWQREVLRRGVESA